VKTTNLIIIILLAIVLLCPQAGSEILTRSDKHPTSIAITIDMCPSSKPYEKKLFDHLEQLGLKLGKPVPVALCLSGSWLLYHEDELADLKARYLDITWVNHSFTHPVENDFLNNPEINVPFEIEANTKLFKKRGLKVSRFFRFPGLRHSEQNLKDLDDLGYIALDADAWVGKGQEIVGGSIILIHGNGNEQPEIVDRFIRYLKFHEWEFVNNELRLAALDDYVAVKQAVVE
jgi:peptidoglycan/xylan/chitin deacetylase (PgdA/CDA1 family)